MKAFYWVNALWIVLKSTIDDEKLKSNLADPTPTSADVGQPYVDFRRHGTTQEQKKRKEETWRVMKNDNQNYWGSDTEFGERLEQFRYYSAEILLIAVSEEFLHLNS